MQQSAQMLNSPQRRWDCNRVCSNNRDVNCTVHWTHRDTPTWIINMYIYKGPVHTPCTCIWYDSLLQEPSLSSMYVYYDMIHYYKSPVYPPCTCIWYDPLLQEPSLSSMYVYMIWSITTRAQFILHVRVYDMIHYYKSPVYPPCTCIWYDPLLQEPSLSSMYVYVHCVMHM